MITLPKNNKNWSHHLIGIYYVAGIFCHVLSRYVSVWKWAKITGVVLWSPGHCLADPQVTI